MKVIPGTIQTCANVLKDASLAISPGGVYEAQFSHHYDLMWKKRLGFAKVALEAKVVSFYWLWFFYIHIIMLYPVIQK